MTFGPCKHAQGRPELAVPSVLCYAPFMKDVRLHLTVAEHDRWTAAARSRHSTLTAHIIRQVNANGLKPSWAEVRGPLLAALGPAWEPWLAANLAPLWPVEAPDPRSLPCGQAETEQARRARQALYTRRTRRRKDWVDGWGSEVQEVFLGVVMDLRKKFKGAPDKVAELEDRARAIRDSGDRDWMSKFLDLFDPLG